MEVQVWLGFEVAMRLRWRFMALCREQEREEWCGPRKMDLDLGETMSFPFEGFVVF